MKTSNSNKHISKLNKLEMDETALKEVVLKAEEGPFFSSIEILEEVKRWKKKIVK